MRNNIALYLNMEKSIPKYLSKTVRLETKIQSKLKTDYVVSIVFPCLLSWVIIGKGHMKELLD